MPGRSANSESGTERRGSPDAHAAPPENLLTDGSPSSDFLQITLIDYVFRLRIGLL